MTIQNSIRDKGGVFHYILFHLSKNGEVLRDVAVGQLVSDQEWSRPLCGSGYGGIGSPLRGEQGYFSAEDVEKELGIHD